jgi:rhamnose transport system ATP-binding protein
MQPGPVPLLEVASVSKSFGAVAAVRDVSFPLFPGEIDALVGENGAGKSGRLAGDARRPA